MVQANEHITTDNEQENTLINRAELWASTMGGREDGSVIHAHSESILYIPFDGPTSIDVVHEQLLNIDARFLKNDLSFLQALRFRQDPKIERGQQTQLIRMISAHVLNMIVTEYCIARHFEDLQVKLKSISTPMTTNELVLLMLLK